MNRFHERVSGLLGILGMALLVFSIACVPQNGVLAQGSGANCDSGKCSGTPYCYDKGGSVCTFVNDKCKVAGDPANCSGCTTCPNNSPCSCS